MEIYNDKDITLDLGLFGFGTLLGPDSGPTLNGLEAGILLSQKILENIVMNTLEDEGRGITQSFTTDTTGAQIKVLHIVPIKGQGRRYGTSINGGPFNDRRPEYAESQVFYIDLLDVFDVNIDIPHVQQSMLPTNLLEEKNIQITQAVSKMMNAMTIAGKVEATFNAGLQPVVWDKSDDDSKNLLKVMIEANAKLNAGDAEHGVQYFPKQGRCCVINAIYEADIFATGIFQLGGANLAYTMLAKGAASPEATIRGNDGYLGTFMGCPIHEASPLVIRDTEKYLGLPEYELEEVIGYFSSNWANSRGLAHDNTIKMINSPDGAGLRLQPMFRMGFKSWYPKGNSFFVTADFVNPVTAIRTVDPNYKLKSLPAGSRSYVDVTWSGGTPTIVVPAGCSIAWKKKADIAADDIPAHDTAAAVITAAGAGNVTDWTSGAISSTSGHRAYLIVEMDDGTILVFGHTIA